MKTFCSGTVLATLLAALAHGCDDEDTPRPPVFTDIGGSLGETFAPLDGGAGTEDAARQPDGALLDAGSADGVVNPNNDDLGGPAPTDNGVVGPTQDLGAPSTDVGFGSADSGGAVGPADNGAVVGPTDVGGVVGPVDNGAVVGPADLGPSGPADNGAVIGPADLGP